MKRTICFVVISLLVMIALSHYDREARTLLRDAEERMNIGNIFSNYELLLEHGYRVERYTYDLAKTGFIENGRYNLRIMINREYQGTSDTNIPFSITTRVDRVVYLYNFSNRNSVYLYQLRVTSEAVEIDFIVTTSYRRSRVIFDELNLVLDVVNLE